MHPTWSTSFKDRASLPGTSPLAAYLLHLIAIKKSNLCLSADVSTTAELLAIAEEVGDSICLLKTHADIINDFSDRTVRGLREIAKRKRFLVFEDRKFGDIGSEFVLSLIFHARVHADFPTMDTFRQRGTVS
jgi:uridine monophosphate synthetase